MEIGQQNKRFYPEIVLGSKDVDFLFTFTLLMIKVTGLSGDPMSVPAYICV